MLFFFYWRLENQFSYLPISIPIFRFRKIKICWKWLLKSVRSMCNARTKGLLSSYTGLGVWQTAGSHCHEISDVTHIILFVHCNGISLFVSPTKLTPFHCCHHHLCFWFYEYTAPHSQREHLVGSGTLCIIAGLFQWFRCNVLPHFQC